MYHNNECDGSGPCSHGETKLLLTGKTAMNGGVILCRACWAREVEWRRARNAKLGDGCKFRTPAFNKPTEYVFEVTP